MTDYASPETIDQLCRLAERQFTEDEREIDKVLLAILEDEIEQLTALQQFDSGGNPFSERKEELCAELRRLGTRGEALCNLGYSWGSCRLLVQLPFTEEPMKNLIAKWTSKVKSVDSSKRPLELWSTSEIFKTFISTVIQHERSVRTQLWPKKLVLSTNMDSRKAPIRVGDPSPSSTAPFAANGPLSQASHPTVNLAGSMRS